MLRVVAPFVVPQALAFLLVFTGIQLAELRYGEAASGVAWGGRVHATPEELRTWLADRGASYDVWADRHPEAAARLERAEAGSAAAAPRLAALPVGKTTLVGAAAALVLAAVAAVLATVGRPLVRRRPGRLARPAVPLTARATSFGRSGSAAARATALVAVDVLARARRSLARARLAGAAGGASMHLAGAAGGSLLAHLWYRRRLDVALWTIGVASSVLIGLLTVRLLA